MKNMKKVVSVLLAVVLCMGLSLTTMAASEYTIQVSNEKSGHTYEAYQIFTGTLFADEETGKYGLTDIQWGDGIKSALFLTALKTVDNTSVLYGMFDECLDAADVAEILDNYNDDDGFVRAFAALLDNYFANAAAESNGASEVGGQYVYEMDVNEPGYYAIVDKSHSVTGEGDAYTESILQVVGTLTEVATKAVYPTVEKDVDEPDEFIGGEVEFTITATIPNVSAYKHYKYTLTDQMSLGLTYQEGSMVVSADDEVLVEGVDYTFSKTIHPTDGTIMVIDIQDALRYSEKTIVLTYQAVLNENAIVGVTGNENEITLEYSNNPNNGCDIGKIDDSVKVFTFDMEGVKVDGDDNAVKLTGAEFVLKNAEGKYYNSDTGVIIWVDDQEDATAIVSNEGGLFTIHGLKTGNYTLIETKAPYGYNLLLDEIPVTVDAEFEDYDEDGNADTVVRLTIQVSKGEIVESSGDDLKGGIVRITVENNCGSILPSTGGIGTKVFYMAGGILMMAAVIVIIARKRVGQME